MKKKLLSMLMASAMLATMVTGCGSNNSQTQSSTNSNSTGTETNAGSETNKTSENNEAASKDENAQITLKVFSNLPDRNNGQGLVEQMIIDEYMAENTNVKIEVETLDEESYKTKFKAYSMDGMPDVVSIWGQPSFLDEVLEAGVLAELNEADYADYGFLRFFGWL